MKIYVDAGHVNNTLDCGATWKSRKESKDCLDLAQLLVCNLKALGVDVKLSRASEKEAKSLTQRTNEANKWGADLYLSIHRNASTMHKADGAETLIYSLASENKAIADKLQKCMVDVAKFKDRGVKARQDLHVLKKTKMVAVLLEVGFIDFDNDNRKFDDYKIELARAIAKVIKNHV